jgi:simple sugar transport system ATP-binding protein
VKIRAVHLVVQQTGAGGTGVRDASFEARGGEVVGIAAVEGNGERELLRAVSGLHAAASGQVEVTGPVSFIPEDRTTEAVVGEFTLTENLVLSQGAVAPWVRKGWLDWTVAARECASLMERFGVHAAGPHVIARSLSGGNQQRMVIAGALERHPSVLVAENITRGLDFQATSAVHTRLREAALAGVCVLLYLTDLDELMEVSDRVLIMAGGVLSEPPPDATRAEIGRRMLGMGG